MSCHSLDVGEELAGLASLLLPCGYLGLNSGQQTGQQSPFPAKPSCQPLGAYLKSAFRMVAFLLYERMRNLGILNDKRIFYHMN